MGRSGALRQRIEIWRKVVDKNEYGEYTETWQFHTYIRAYVYHKSGFETISNEEIFDAIKLRIQIRNQADVQEMDRIKYFGKMYQIDFIQPDDIGRWLMLHCSKLNE